MSDKEDGDPGSVRHLRPTDMPQVTTGQIIELPEIEGDFTEELFAKLEQLRAPFSPEEWEKRPQPMWKGAWDDQPKGRCEVCGGYHALANTIHLDYVGHAGVTKRLLDTDPLWRWKPLATDEFGLPKYDQFGGLWIKLRVCGVTRLGYGDAVGKSASSTAVKEIIGDAIRNAAMRFGVALELWSKLDRHEGINPSATGQTQGQQRGSGKRSGDKNAGRSPRADGDKARVSDSRGKANAPSNQDALDEVTSICDTHGYSYEYANTRFEDEYGIKPIAASAEQLREFGAQLVAEATVDPRTENPGGDAEGGSTEGDGAVADRDPLDGSTRSPAPEGPLF